MKKTKLLALVLGTILLVSTPVLAVSILSVPQGGTGTNTLTGLIKGNGTSPFTVASAGTDYISAVNTDSTLTGSGTSGSALGFNLTNPNTWLSALQTFNRQALTNTVAAGISLTNTTAATNGARVQNSPSIFSSGTGWTGSASQVITVKQTLEPGTQAGRWTFSWDGVVGATTTTGLMTLTNAGDITALRNLTASTGAVTAQSGVIQSGGSAFDGLFRLAGSSMGNVDITVPASVTAYTIILPNAQGTGALTNDGVGNLSWATGGTVTSVRCGTGLTGGTFTTSGTCALDVANPNAWSGLQEFASGDFQLDGATSGNIGISAAGTVTSYNLTLPAAQGASGETLINNGSGVLTWGSGSGANTALSNLASVAINSDLFPGVTNTINLGSTTKTFHSLAFTYASGTATDPDLYWQDNVHGVKDGFRANLSSIYVDVDSQDVAIFQANGGTPFMAVGVLAAKKIGNVGATAELSGLEGIADGSLPTYSNPSLVLTASPTGLGDTQPQHYWQQSAVTTTNNTPTTFHQYNLGANTAVKLHWSIIAIRKSGTSGSTNDTASWDITCTYKDLSATATLVGTCHTVADKDNTNLDVTRTVTGRQIETDVTGDTNNTYEWHQTEETEFVN